MVLIKNGNVLVKNVVYNLKNVRGKEIFFISKKSQILRAIISHHQNIEFSLKKDNEPGNFLLRKSHRILEVNGLLSGKYK